MSGELRSGAWTGNWNSVGGLRGWRMRVLPGFQNTKQVVFSRRLLAGWGRGGEGRSEYKVGRLLEGWGLGWLPERECDR